MFSAVHQYINQRVTDGTRRSQRTGVIAIRADGAAAAQRAVHRSRDADGQPADATPERSAVIGFGDQMKVVTLEAEVDDAKAAA